MKAFRVLGAVLCVFGCFFALLGILTSILPMIENEQFKLIVNSFQEPSADPLTNTLNSIVLFCLHSGYFLLFSGISLTVTGGLISSAAHKRQKSEHADAPLAPVTPKTHAASEMPKPAYYPGGLAPPTVSLGPETVASAPKIISTMDIQTSAPISGGVEPAFSSDESDAQKLMLNDEQLQHESQQRNHALPDYSQYPSNSAVPKQSAAAKKAPTAQESRKPRIVSTMGKK